MKYFTSSIFLQSKIDNQALYDFSIVIRWTPDAIVFDSHQVYGTPSYWLIKLFKESSGATFLNSTLQTDSPTLAASAISWKSSVDGKSVLRIKVNRFSSAYLLFDLKYVTTIISGLGYIRICRLLVSMIIECVFC